MTHWYDECKSLATASHCFSSHVFPLKEEWDGGGLDRRHRGELESLEGLHGGLGEAQRGPRGPLTFTAPHLESLSLSGSLDLKCVHKAPTLSDKNHHMGS